MTFSNDSKPHIRHIRDLEQLLVSAPGREYSLGSEPDDYLEYWRPHFAGLFLISIYIYINEQAGSEKFWNTSNEFSEVPNLIRCLEIMRIVRNQIVHHGGKAPGAETKNGKLIRSFESDVASKAGIEIPWRETSVRVRPFYLIGPAGRIKMLPEGQSMVRFLAVAALEIEGIVLVKP